jgi:exopolysaccharide biosynthesis polyprenyl glycosylphosphotransferase
MSNIILKIKKFTLLIGDIAMMYLALYFTLLIRYGQNLDNLWIRHLLPFSLLFIIWIIVIFISNLYDLKTSHNNYNLVSNIFRIIIINAVLSIAFFYFITPLIETIRPQIVLAIDLIIFGFLFFLWRKVFYKLIKSSVIANQVLIIGKSPLGEGLESQINKRPQLGYQAILLDSAPENLNKYCVDKQIDILVNADLDNTELSRKMFSCLSLEVDVYNITSFYEYVTGKVPVKYIEHGWFLDNLNEHSKKAYETSKRFFDIILAIIGLIVSIVLAPPIALAIKLNSKGPVIFKQYRVGKNGKEFLAMKFRSMVIDSEKNGPKWTTVGDTRITKVGNIIRKVRLDEIPQLINILRGEMSFVGPRPEQPRFVEQLSTKIPFYQERLLVRPGIAGWAQLNAPHHGAGEKDSLDKLKYDLYYIKNRSLILDITIILKTLKIVIAGKGQ